MRLRASQKNQPELGCNYPIFACTIFPPYFGQVSEVGTQQPRGLQNFFIGNIGRVFHNICSLYDSKSLNIYQSGRARKKVLIQWIGA